MHDKRRKRLIRPRLQIRLILSFFGVALFALLLQFILFAASIMSLASELPSDGPLLLERATTTSLFIVAISIGVLLPLSFGIGVLVTFRVAGPLYRFEKHLETIAAGRDPGTCRLRKGDQLQELCVVMNKALDRLRLQGAFREPIEEEPLEQREAA